MLSSVNLKTKLSLAIKKNKSLNRHPRSITEVTPKNNGASPMDQVSKMFDSVTKKPGLKPSVSMSNFNAVRATERSTNLQTEVSKRTLDPSIKTKVVRT